MTNFKSSISNLDLETSFLREAEILERFVGNKLFSWGFNGTGHVGDNTIIHRSVPVQTVAGGTNWLSVSRQAGIKTDGTLWIWGGGNGRGRLGTNDRTNRSSPVQTVLGGNNWYSVSIGGESSAAIKTDGTLWTWGGNTWGYLGTNDRTHRSSPVQTVAGGNNWKEVSVGAWEHMGAIKTDGTLWMWGSNSYGELGDNSRTHRSSPVQTVFSLNDWKRISCGAYHTAAIKNDNSLWTWGMNQYFNSPTNGGQLGTNDTVHRSSPVQTVALGNDWKMISAGGYHCAAIKMDGTLWTWGSNSEYGNPNISGQLGDGGQVHRSSPVQTISGGSNWKFVSAGMYTTAAIKTDGTLWTWGNNTIGYLGIGDRTHRSSPVQVVSEGTNWKAISADFDNMTAITYIES